MASFYFRSLIILWSSTTSNTGDNTLRNAFQPHPRSTSTQSNTTSNTLTFHNTSSATPPTPFRDQAPPSTPPTTAHATSSATISNHIRDQTPPETSQRTPCPTPLPHAWSGTTNDTLDDTLPPEQTKKFRDHPPPRLEVRTPKAKAIWGKNKTTWVSSLPSPLHRPPSPASKAWTSSTRRLSSTAPCTASWRRPRTTGLTCTWQQMDGFCGFSVFHGRSSYTTFEILDYIFGFSKDSFLGVQPNLY